MKKKNIILKIIHELSAHPGYFFSSVFITLIITAVSTIRPLLVNHILNNVQNSTTAQITILGTMLIGLMFLESTLQYINSVLSLILGQKLTIQTRQKLFHHITHLPVSYFDKTPVGNIVTRIVSDIEAMNEIFADGFTTILGSIITIIVFITTMLYVNVTLALSVLAVLPFLLLAVWLFKNGVQKSFTQVRNAIANLNKFTQEHLVGMPIVQQFHAEKEEFEKFKLLNQQHKNAHIQYIWYYSIFFPILELLSSIAIALVIYRSSLLPHISLGEITFFVMMTQMLFRPLRMLADQLNTLQMGLIAADRVYRLMDEHIPQPNDGTKIFHTLQKGITFKDVTFYYQDKHVPVLSDINLFIPAHQVTAIVGHTGSGKTTLVNLIGRLYDITEGDILLDDVPIQHYTIHSLRSRISVILQDPHLFNDSILNNVRMFNPKISRDIVEQAARDIGIHEFIMQLENNYDYIIQERGANLSSGQKQLIAFLRAYIHQPDIFILDEATSMIDSVTEQLIQNVLKKVLYQQTAIIIAHRLSTIQMAQQIVVMQKGQIVEKGTHQELLKRNGYYKAIYQLQFEGGE